MKLKRKLVLSSLVVFSLTLSGQPVVAADSAGPKEGPMYIPESLAGILKKRYTSAAPWKTYLPGEMETEQRIWDRLALEAEDDPNEMPANDDDVPVQQSNIEPSQAPIAIDVFRRPVGLGVSQEFLVVSKNDIPISAHIISTAKAGKVAIGDSAPARRSYMAQLELINPKTGGQEYAVDLSKADLSVKKPYPFHRSSTYASSMYWGLRIDGGYWIHATPHYKELGKPASMGCIRVNNATAMELYDLAVNESRGNVAIHLHTSVSESKRKEAQERWTELGLTPQWVLAHITRDLQDALAQPLDAKGDFKGIAHARVGHGLKLARCGDVDCFETFPKIYKAQYKKELVRPLEFAVGLVATPPSLPKSPKQLQQEGQSLPNAVNFIDFFMPK